MRYLILGASDASTATLSPEPASNNPNLMNLLLQSGFGTEYGRNPFSWLGFATHTEVRKAAQRRLPLQPSFERGNHEIT
jgi:hypothetical protein